MTETSEQRVRELRTALLQLHKVLLEGEQRSYERGHGRIASSAELLQIVMHDPRFAWLHSLSELVVRIDEMLDADEPIEEEARKALFSEARSLVTPSETGSGRAKRYHIALQRDPAVVVAHGELVRVLAAK
jgi:hypothetical protein